MKKEWRMPMLIVLVRSLPEESILSTCKFEGDPSPNNTNMGCQQFTGQFCPDCEHTAPS